MLSDVLALVSGVPPRTSLPAKAAEYLRRHAVPEDIIRDLEACSFPDWVSVGPLSLVPMPELAEQTEGVRECIERGYLVLAGGRNGDPVAVDLRTRRMVYVSHELLWSDRRKQFEDCVHPTPLRYEEFWTAAASDPDFPCDFYEARNRWPTGRPELPAEDGPTLRLFPPDPA